MFELTGLPPAPQGVPQIEVTFDIDANGIVNVSAVDKGTGKSQAMTITGGSALSKDEIDRMVSDAEAHADEDRQRREAAETRNQAESLVHQTEKVLSENGDKVPAEVKDKVQGSLDDLKKALQGDDTEAVKSAVEKLATDSQELGQAIYSQAQASDAAGAADEGATSGGDDDVVDAEIVDDDKKQ
jgi:molecular chaperone DnaK